MDIFRKEKTEEVPKSTQSKCLKIKESNNSSKDENSSSQKESKSQDKEKGVVIAKDKDKLELDLELAIGNILKDKQLKNHLLKNMENELENTGKNCSDLKQELNKANSEISEKQKIIEDMKEKMAIQKMNFDQLVEDYKDLQNMKGSVEEEIKYQLEREQSKYENLHEEYEKYKLNSIKEIKGLKEIVRDKEIENEQLKERNKKMQEDKSSLLETINDFTERMSGSIKPFNKEPLKTPIVQESKDTNSTDSQTVNKKQER